MACRSSWVRDPIWAIPKFAQNPHPPKGGRFLDLDNGQPWPSGSLISHRVFPRLTPWSLLRRPEEPVVARGAQGAGLSPQSRSERRDDQGRPPGGNFRRVDSQERRHRRLESSRGHDSLVRWRPPCDGQDSSAGRQTAKVRGSVRDRPAVFPAPSRVRPGKPLIVCEGEFDAILLRQELAEHDLAVVTLGSAWNREGHAVQDLMLTAHLVSGPGQRPGRQQERRGMARRAKRVKAAGPMQGLGRSSRCPSGMIRQQWAEILVRPHQAARPTETRPPSLQPPWPPRPAELGEWPIEAASALGRAGQRIGSRRHPLAGSRASGLRTNQGRMRSNIMSTQPNYFAAVLEKARQNSDRLRPGTVHQCASLMTHGA